MQRLKDIIIAVLLIALFWVWNTNAGTPTGPNTPPDSTYWYTIDGIYERLNAGTTGSQSAFTEPTSAPGTQTTITLNDVMDKAPAANNTNGAEPGEVLSGNTYWSLRTDGSGSSKWGVLTGTLPTQTLIDSSMDIKAGYYTTTTLKSVDSDFVNTNIKSGVEMFGVAGNVIEATGNATAADVLTGKTFSNDSSANLTGMMVNHGSKSYTPTASVQTITAGYYNGTGKVNTDSDLIASNIKKNVDIFGVTGTVIEASGTVTASYVLDGSTFSNETSAGLTGSMTNNGAQIYTPSPITQTVAAGYHNGDGKVKGDGDLAAGNIKKDVDIFGVTGTFEGGPTCSGTLNGTRWCDNENGTVTDLTTGLIWLKKADWGGKKKIYESNVSTENAHDRASLLKAGATDAELNDGSVEGDWRLPTKSELSGLISGNESVRSGNMRAFTGVQADIYWSSTTSSSNSRFAWFVSLSFGDVSGVVKTGDFYVWPVRDGQ